MKIWGEIPKVSGVYGKQKGVDKVEKSSAVKARKDIVSISTQAKDYQTAVKAVKETPDIRQERVNEVLEKYKTGGYDVKGRDIADNIIKSIIDKKV